MFPLPLFELRVTYTSCPGIILFASTQTSSRRCCCSFTNSGSSKRAASSMILFTPLICSSYISQWQGREAYVLAISFVQVVLSTTYHDVHSIKLTTSSKSCSPSGASTANIVFSNTASCTLLIAAVSSVALATSTTRLAQSADSSCSQSKYTKEDKRM